MHFGVPVTATVGTNFIVCVTFFGKLRVPFYTSFDMLIKNVDVYFSLFASALKKLKHGQDSMQLFF